MSNHRYYSLVQTCSLEGQITLKLNWKGAHVKDGLLNTKSAAPPAAQCFNSLKPRRQTEPAEVTARTGDGRAEPTGQPHGAPRRWTWKREGPQVGGVAARGSPRPLLRPSCPVRANPGSQVQGQSGGSGHHTEHHAVSKPLGAETCGLLPGGPVLVPDLPCRLQPGV